MGEIHGQIYESWFINADFEQKVTKRKGEHHSKVEIFGKWCRGEKRNEMKQKHIQLVVTERNENS